MPGRILVADNVATNRISLKASLSEACYEVLQAETGSEALRAAKTAGPDMILLASMMDGAGAERLCRKLKCDPKTADIPVIMIGTTRDGNSMLRALREGAEDLLVRPIDEPLLLARVRSALRERQNAQGLLLRDGPGGVLGFAEQQMPAFSGRSRLALIGPRSDEAMNTKAALSDSISADISIMSREEALAIASADQSPEVFVVSADLDDTGAGLTVLTDLRARPATRRAAVIVTVPANRGRMAAMALDLGASDIAQAPIDHDELVLRITTQLHRKREADRLQASLSNGLRMAMTDPLTGLYNRRYALPQLARTARRAAKERSTFAVLLLDLDRFKTVNDRYGHAAGDVVLCRVAARLSAHLWQKGLVARLGGEEFLIVLPETERDQAVAAAERIRRIVSDTLIPLPGAAGALCVSASIGVATSDGSDASVDDLLARADSALYAAKSRGRNTVTTHFSAA